MAREQGGSGRAGSKMVSEADHSIKPCHPVYITKMDITKMDITEMDITIINFHVPCSGSTVRQSWHDGGSSANPNPTRHTMSSRVARPPSAHRLPRRQGTRLIEGGKKKKRKKKKI